MTTISYQNLNQQLQQASIPLSAAELHGFLSGLICGGIKVGSHCSINLPMIIMPILPHF